MFNTSNLYNSSSNLGGPPLWYQFAVCAAAPYGFVFYFAVKVLNLAVGTPCNILVILQIAIRKKDASTSDIFIFSLAVLDAFFCLMTPVELVNRLLLDDSQVWYFQRFTYGMKDAAPLFLVCICADRYMAVVHPTIFTSYRDNMTRIVISVVAWALIVMFSFTRSFMLLMTINDIFSGIILFAFAVMVFCNISVIWALRRSVAGKEKMNPVKKRAFKIVLINLAIIVFNYLPSVALMPFVSYYTFIEFNCQISITVFSFLDLSCSIEPLMYMTKIERGDVSCCSRASQ